MDFTIVNNNINAEIALDEMEKEGIFYVTFRIQSEDPQPLESVILSWKTNVAECYSVWSPSIRQARNLGPNWEKRKTSSRLASFMPMHQIVSVSGRNCINIAVADCTSPISISTGICEEDASVECEIEFFTLPIAVVNTYSTVIRLDMRDIPYYDSIYDTVDWWEKDCGYKSAHVPDVAKRPMNSLWYSYHQNLDADSIVKECKWSKPLGIDTVIIDDGWQTDDRNQGYAYCGDWKPSERKMGDMKELVECIHENDMKVILWYSVPFVGVYSEKYQEFQGMLLAQSGDKKTYYALDPRYKRVRDYLIDVYTTAVSEWKLDGLKLDFIDSFILEGASLEYDPKRDYLSLEQAIDVLFTDLTNALRSINSEIMIEFRQRYVGPSIRKYGNMLRVLDCPYDAIMNRQDIVNLRYTSGRTAVHSDMIMWNPEESVESAALQFAHILYGVPQISMRCDCLFEAHKKMIQYYLSFWQQWKNVLLEGKLIAKNPEAQYSQVCSELHNKSVITVYTDRFVELETEHAVIVNAAERRNIVIKSDRGRDYCIVNCVGEELKRGKMQQEIQELEIPMAGFAFIS